MTKAQSAILIGGGHNGLICAAYLARKGIKVVLLEARDTLGGALGLCSSHMSLHPSIIKDLKLPKAKSPPLKTIALGVDGNHRHFSAGTVTGDEAEAYADFYKEYLSYAKALGPLMLNTPPRLKDFDRMDALTLGKMGWSLRVGLGAEAMREFLRVAGMNIYDVLEERLSDPLLQGAAAFDAVLGNHVGPRTPNTVLPFLMRLFHQDGNARIDSGQTATALEAAARKAGVDLRTQSRVTRIVVEEDQAAGVELAGGEELRADIIISNADAKTTFNTLVGTQQLDALFAHRINKTRTNGDVARLTLTLKETASFKGLSETDMAQRLVIAPDMKTIERAFNASKYGEYSQKPVMEMTYSEGRLAITAAYAPYHLKEGWEAGAAGFQANILAVLEDYAPGISRLVDTSELLSPVDIERDFGTTGGHWHHGDMALDQSFMMRPVHGTAQYETPLPGLYLCGAAAHPGGDITGLPGRNAAKRILKTA